MATIIAMTNVGVEPSEAAVDPAQIGSGFAVTSSDLAFILQQIKIAEYHAQHINENPANPCAALVGNDPHQIPSPLLSLGLRTVDGTCNNIQPGQESFGAALEVFPRLTVPNFERPADLIPAGFPGAGTESNYNQTAADSVVFDSRPRMVSNLVVDQTSTNPAAVHVAGNPFRTQANPDIVVPCTTEPTTPDGTNGLPEGCVPQYQTLFIANITTDVGLSPPFNSLFTIFGQFFDHGVDKINNGGNGAVFVPLREDDPLISGPDHILVDDPNTPVDESADNLPPQQRFMVLTRGTIVNDPVTNVRSALNSDTPFVDQSQTYTSHSSVQVFTREYVPNVDGRPMATGKFLETNGGLPTWATVKSQASTLLGLELVDADVNNIPMIAADPYGNFIPGANGLPQYMTATGLVEGNLAAPVPAPANVLRIEIAFLNDIAHSAAPTVHLDCSALPPGSPPDTPCLPAGDPNIGTLFPDTDTVPGTSLATTSPAGSYDNELLDLHFICGDGRCNENIALSAVHQVFHAEHNRLVDYITNQGVDTLPPGVLDLTENAALLADFRNVNPNGDPAIGPYKTFTYEERLFQAARFVTEMEYQHLVFEEFARKIQPLINPFQPFAFNQTDLNPATTAEFAHAVYRFGHSMLTDTIPRVNTDGTHFDIPLLDGFLNPAAYNDGGRLTAPDAAGAILMGLSDQTGQEIDEFVTETLRNHLLGLPLDLPSINMARARSEGIPPLNDVRRQIFAETNDGQLKPYASWFEFGEKLKHTESLVNFIAAYGTHPTITAATTLADKRAAAQALIDTMNTDPDARAFIFGTIPDTGIDDIDLWMGGLAENTNLFGGLLGPTFNYVFEKQLTDLQNGDRFYYLARTPGMNLRSQLEGNSFSELVMRNTPAHTLKADPFATADCKFELANLAATPAGFAEFGAIVADDPASECDESVLLARLPDGTIQYRAINAEDPPGINGQSVYNGTDFADSMYGGNDNDTFWGGLGNDRIDGGAGDDVVLGGEGNDIITDFGGFDVLKGGPGNDAIDGGAGDDIIMSGEGKDFTNGGANINETFAGPGDDFAIAGQGEDAVFGDDGDDWEEGGDMPDLLIGDSSTLFFDDHNLPGHDILIGQGGDDDYDMEGGDDIGVAGPGVEKVAGAAGYDWEIGLWDPQPQDADLDLLIVNTPPVNETRDRYNEVEALSGWKFNDKLRGDSVIPSQVGGGGFIGCDALDAAGVARINGLDALVRADMLTVPSAEVIARSVTNYCLLEGNVWGEGNILLGGEGSDELEGRGGNDILDGDRYLNVRLSVRSGVDPATGEATGPEIGTTDLMKGMAVPGGNFGPGTEGMNLQQAVFAGLVNPGQIVAVREILTPTVPAADCGAATPLNCDTALFSGPSVNYTITPNADGSVTVADNNAGGGGGGGGVRNDDGVDILWHIEQLSFCRTPGLLRNTCDEREPPISVASVVAPVAEVTPTVLAFGDQVVGGTVTTQAALALQAIRVTNSGLSPLEVSGVTMTGDSADFVLTNGCTAPVLPGGFCDITVQFAPTTEGDKTATITITHNGAGSPSIVTVTGRGIPSSPIAAFAPAALDFGNQVVGTASTAQAITVTNNGTQDLIVSGASLTGLDATQFSLTNGCTTVVAPGLSCTVSVQFGPTTLGDKTVTVDIVHNATGSPTSVAATGTGINAETTATIADARIGGGGGLRIGRSVTNNVRVTNTGANPLVITSVSTSSPFAATLGTCTGPVAPGRTCNLSVTFTPTAAQAYSVPLTIDSNAEPSPTATLTGTGR